MRARLLVAVLALLFVQPATAQYTSFGQNKVRYDTFNWEVYPTPHFRISFYDREAVSLSKLASFAESAYDELARRLNFQIAQPIPLIAYTDHAEFEQTNVIADFIPEGVGAFAVPARNRMVLPVDLPDDQLQRLIQHELTHIFQYEILFQGSLGKALTSAAPQWFMEGMASYMAQDEDSRAEAFMRDAVVSDRVPSVGGQVAGYFAYRFGHMVFQFVESEWGVEGLRDFIYEFRTSLAGNIEKPLKRAFDLDVEEFDGRFRAWLRHYYQPIIQDRGDARDFGPAFREPQTELHSYQVSPVASPSGDLIAAFSTHKDSVDITVFGVPNRSLFRNLTSTFTTRYEYLVAQMLTVGPDRGRDLAFSPDGNLIAVFARRERGRALVLVDAIHGGIARMLPIPVDQAMEPAFSPDGETIAFHAFAGGKADIYLLDLASGKLRNLTDDPAYHSAPVFAADGKHIIFSSQSAEYAKLFEVSLDNPHERRQLTFGPGNDEGAAFSRDGKRLYFASDRDQRVFDIYALDLTTHELTRLTKVYGSALNPVAVPTRDGERVVYQAFAKGRYWLYITDPAQGKPVGKEEPPKVVAKSEPYVPSVTVPVNKDKIEAVKSHKLFVEDVGVNIGFNTDNTLLANTYVSFTDQYGDRRFILFIQGVEDYQTFQLAYVNLAKRLQWGAMLLDDRSYYVAYDTSNGRAQRVQQAYGESGGYGFVSYPLSLYHRAEGAVGFFRTSRSYPDTTNESFITFTNNVPFIEGRFVGDTTSWRDYGWPHAGRRWTFSVGNYFNGGGGGTLSRDLSLDVRQYVPLSRRNELAFRLFVGASTGQQPDLFYFGGVDTMRGFDYNTLWGNRTAYLNTEWRFPLIDYLIFPWLRLGNLRGRFFLDVGAAYIDFQGSKFTPNPYPPYNYKQGFTFWKDGRLQDGVSSYGFGFSIDLFGVPLHFDWAKQWDFKTTFGGFASSFWIGYRF